MAVYASPLSRAVQTAEAIAGRLGLPVQTHPGLADIDYGHWQGLTPDEVRAVVKDRIETVGRGGGLLLAPSHVLEPEVPWRNVVAFVAAVEEYGVY